MGDIKSEGIRAIEKDEHNDDAHAKRVVLRHFNTDTGEYENVSSDNPIPVDIVGSTEGIVIDTNNTTTAVLAAGATYTGTATDVLSYQQQVVNIFARPGVVAGDGSSAKASFYFEFSKDGTNWDTSVPHLIRDPSLVIPIPVITIHRYFRVRYINDGGTAAIAALGLTETAGTPTLQTVFRLTTYLYPNATKELTRTLDQGVSGSDPVNLSRVVLMGKSTDETYQNKREDGVSSGNSSAATLGSGGVFTGTVFDAKGYAAYAVLAKSNVSSASTGLAVQFSDTSTFTTVRAEDTYTYTATDGVRFSGPTKARYIRVVYTNGGSAQSSFFLETTLSVVPSQVPISTPEAGFTASTNVATGRNVLVAKGRTSGTYSNVLQGDNGGAEVDLRALTGTTQMQQTSVTGTASQFASTPLTGRRSIMFLAPTANTKIVSIGKSNAITVTSGSVQLGPGASMTIDIDDTDNDWWAIAESGTQRVCWVEVS